MQEKMNVADFAALVGTSSKTIYQKILNNSDLPVNEQLITVKEKIKGRETTLILTNSEQINYYQNLYGKQPVIESECYENLTLNNGNKPFTSEGTNEKTNNINNFDDDMLERLITVNNEFNNRYEQKITELIEVHNELAEVKGRQLLLEDKAGREGLYLNEINGLKKDNNRLHQVIYGLVTLLVILLLGLTGYITYTVTVNYHNKHITDAGNETVTEETINPDIKKVAQENPVPRNYIRED